MRKVSLSLLGLLVLSTLLAFRFSPQWKTVQFIEYGIATCYSEFFDGRLTAYGEVYHKNQLTGAHKSLPYNTIVRVTRLDNKKSVVVRINDKGAFPKGRIIDLSEAAAAKLDIPEEGKANVKLEVIKKPEPGQDERSHLVAVNKAPGEVRPNADTAHVNAEAKQKDTGKKAQEKAQRKAQEKAPGKGTKKKAKPKKAARRHIAPLKGIITGKNYRDFSLYKIKILRPAKEGFGVQVGLLRNNDNVFKFVAELQEDFFKNILVSVEETTDGSQYRIILGPFPTPEQALSYKKNVEKKRNQKAFVINLENLSKLSAKEQVLTKPAPFDLYKIQILQPEKKGFGVQVGIFHEYDNVFKFMADLQEDFFKDILLSVEQTPDGPQYRVILRSFDTRKAAQHYRNNLEKKKKLNGFVINLNDLSGT